MTLVSGCLIDLSIVKLQLFADRVNPDSPEIKLPLPSTILQLL